jgi:TetR/AcrR family transcriptional repressor of nem operon
MPWEKQFDKQAALDQALQTFWSHGYEATSMQDLVDCMGVNRGSLYATFGDKRALFIAALRAYDQHRQQMLAEFEARFPPREAIRQVFLAFTGSIEESGSRGCFLTNTALELAAHDDELRQIVAEAQADVEGYFARMIRKGKADGSIVSELKSGAAARGLLASLLGVLVLVRSRPEPALLKTIVDDAMRRLE